VTWPRANTIERSTELYKWTNSCAASGERTTQIALRSVFSCDGAGGKATIWSSTNKSYKPFRQASSSDRSRFA